MSKETYIDEIADYVKKNLKKGYSKESLKWALIQQGYSKIEVEKGLKRVEQEMAMRAPVRPSEKQATMVEPFHPVVEEKKSFWKKIFG